jgi:ABC-type antimicrobial peptide transport system permease subunit
VNLVLKEGSRDRWEDRIQYFESVRAAIASDPEVTSAAIGQLPPSLLDSTPVTIPAQRGSNGNVISEQVSPEYFSTLGTRLLLGRIWESAEARHAVRLAVINESMRRRYWAHANPIGQTIVLNNGIANGNVWRLVAPGDDQHFQIIGVVEDVPNKGLGESTYPAVFIPYSMTPFDGFNVVFRTRDHPGDIGNGIRRDVHTIDADQAVGNLVTANQLLEGDNIGRERFAALLFTAFALLGLVFAISGLYSVQSYFVALRTQEFGVRIALGAGRAHIIQNVTRGCAVAVLSGSCLGVVASLAMSRLFASWTNGNARDPATLAMTLGILFFAAAVASVGPALRAASIDPARALRSE